jgi:hypothetical protein
MKGHAILDAACHVEAFRLRINDSVLSPISEMDAEKRCISDQTFQLLRSVILHILERIR